MSDSNAAVDDPLVEKPDPNDEGVADDDPASTSEDFENAEVDDLKADVPVGATPESIRAPNGKPDGRKLVLELRRTRFQKTQQSTEINRLHQQNEMRPKFFGWQHL